MGKRAILIGIITLILGFYENSYAQIFIQSLNPDKNSYIQNENPTISITFNVDLNTNTVNDSTFKVFGSYHGYVPSTISYDAFNYQVDLSPSTNFISGEKVTVVVTDDVVSITDDTLSVGFNYSFYIDGTDLDGLFNFPALQVASLNVSKINCKNILSGDFHPDGDLDLVSNYDSQNYLYLFKNNEISYTLEHSDSLYITIWFDKLLPASVDSNQYPDIAFLGGGTEDIGFIKNNGDGTFALYGSKINDFNTFPDIDVGDYLSDGIQDMYTVKGGGLDSLVVFKPNPSGQPVNLYSLKLPQPPKKLKVGDLNGDGIDDIVIATGTSPNVKLYTYVGDSAGAFAPKDSMIVESRIISIDLKDSDLDGDLDLFFVKSLTSFNDSVYIYTGMNDGTFIPSQQYWSGSDNITDMKVIDMNVDGNLDIILSNSDNTTVQNDSIIIIDPASGPGYTYLSGMHDPKISVGDFDNNGSIDITAAYNDTSGIGSYVTIYKNLSSSLSFNKSPQDTIVFDDSVMVSQTDSAFLEYYNQGITIVIDSVMFSNDSVSSQYFSIDTLYSEFTDTLFSSGTSTSKIKLNFAPQDTGTFQDTLFTYMHTSADTILDTTLIIGNAVPSNLPLISINPTSLVFDTVNTGYYDTLYVTVYNTGGDTLNVDSVMTPPEFDVEPFSYSGIAVGDSSVFTVIFSPNADSTYLDSVYFYSNDFLNSPIGIQVQGVGQAIPRLVLSSLSYNFGAVVNGDTLEAATVTIRNIGADTASITNVTPSIAEFSVLSSSFPDTLSPDSAFTYMVRFVPSSVSSFSGNLTFSTTDGNNPNLVFEVSGLGIEPTVGTLTYLESKKDGIDGVDGTANVREVIVSPDGSHVYTVGKGDNAIGIFSRNSDTGVLTYIEMEQDGVNGVDGIANTMNAVISPDGANLYVTGYDDNAVAVFGRDQTTGSLTYFEMQENGVNGVEGMNGPGGVTVTPDGAHVLVAGYTSDEIAIFERNPDNGKLNFVSYERNGIDGVTGMDGPRLIRVSPDGRNVYVASTLANTIVVFDRSSLTGELTYVEYVQDGLGGVDGIAGIKGINISPDGKNVYAAGPDEDAVAVFSRDPNTGSLTFIEMEQTGVNGVEGLDACNFVVVSPDGGYVYATGYNDSTVTVFSRNKTDGALTFVDCNKEGQNGIINLVGPFGITISPNGKNVYVSAWDAGAVVNFNVDSTVFEITNVSVNKYQFVTSEAHIEVTFNKNVDASSITDSSIIVYSENFERQPPASMNQPISDKIEYVPQKEYPPADKITVVVSKNLRSVDGDTLGNNAQTFVLGTESFDDDNSVNFADSSLTNVLATVSTDKISDAIPVDIDGDDVMDVAAISYEGYLLEAINNNNGYFSISEYSIGLGINNKKIKSGDFNNDGTIDYVIKSGGTLQIINGSDYTTMTGTSLLASGTLDFEIIDINYDGHLDLLATVDAAGIIYLTEILNDGNGVSFTQTDKITYDNTGITGYGRRFTTGDFDGDGILDVGIIHNNGIFIYNRFQSNTYTKTDSIALDSTLIDIKTGDVDGDYYADIIISQSTSQASDSVYVLINDGSGAFTTINRYGSTADFSNSESETVNLKDYDGDADLDILLNSNYGNNIVCLTNNGSGVFNTAFDFSPITGPLFPAAVSADFDDDLDIDVVTYSPDKDSMFTLSYYKNVSTNSIILLTPEALSWEYVVEPNLTDTSYFSIINRGLDTLTVDSVRFKSTNADSTTEFKVVSVVDSLLYKDSINVSVVFRPASVGIYTDTVLVYSNASNNSVYEFEVSAECAYPVFAVSSVEPTANTFVDKTLTEIRVTFSTAVNPASADTFSVKVFGSLSGYIAEDDGVLDLGNGNKDISFRLGESLIPGEKITMSISDSVRSSSGDSLNFGYTFSYYVKAYDNDNQAIFTDTVSSSIELNKITDIAYFDVSGDNKTDGFYTYLNASGILKYFTGDGQGGFSGVSSYTYTGTPDSMKIKVTDFNKDGFYDVISTNKSINTILYLENNGNNTWTTEKKVGYQDGKPECFDVGDINGDGYFDIVVGNHIAIGIDSIDILYGDTLGTISDSTRIGVPGFPVDIMLHDFTDDGHLDAAVLTGQGIPKLLIYRNINGTLINVPDLETNLISEPIKFAAGQIDNNNQIDIAVAYNCAGGSDTVEVFYNYSCGNTNFSSTEFLVNTSNDSISDIIVNDLDYNLFADIVVAYSTGDVVDDTIAVWLSSNLGFNTLPDNYITVPMSDVSQTGNYPTMVNAIDADGDDDLDLVVTGYTTSPVLMAFLNKPQSGFVQLSTQSINFGYIMIDSVSTQSFTVYNEGSDTVFVDSVYFDSDPTDTTFTFSPGTVTENDTILASDSVIIQVNFKPESLDNFSDIINFAYKSNLGTGGQSSDTLNVDVSGAGISSGGNLVLSPFESGHDFGVSQLNQDKSRNYLLTNSGSDTVFVDSVWWKNGGLNGVFRFSTFSDTLNDTILSPVHQPGDSAYLGVLFNPTSAIEYEDTVSIKYRYYDNNAILAVDTLELSFGGYGQTQNGQLVFINPAQPIDFGYRVTGQSYIENIRIINEGADSVFIDSVYLPGELSGAFYTQNLFIKDTVLSINDTLTGGIVDSFLFDLVFNPTSVTEYKDTLYIVYDAKSGTSITKDTLWSEVYGDGQSPGGDLVTYDGTNTLNFSNVVVGDTMQYMKMLINQGADTVFIDSIYFVNGTEFRFTSITKTGYDTLLMIDTYFDTSFVQAEFTPLTQGEKSDTIIVAYQKKDGGSIFPDTMELYAQGFGTPNEGVLLINPNQNMDFGYVLVGEKDTLRYTLVNQGADTVFVDSIYFEYGGAYNFTTFSDTLNDTLVGINDYPDSSILEVEFTPFNVQEYSDYVNILYTRNTTGGPVADTVQIGIIGSGQSTRGMLSFYNSPVNPMDFGNRVIYSSTYFPVRIKNTGADTVFIDSVYFVKSGDGGFTIQNLTMIDTVYSVNEMPDSNIFDIEFYPDTIRNYLDTLFIVYFAKDGLSTVKDTLDTEVTGSGQSSGGDLVIYDGTNTLNFSNVLIGDTLQYMKMLINQGADTVFIDSIYFVNGTEFGFTSITKTGYDTLLTIDTYFDTSFVQAEFTPLTQGEKSDTIIVAYQKKDGGSIFPDTMELYAQGYGVPNEGILVMEPDQEMDYSFIVVGDTATKSRTIYNQGGDTVFVDTMFIHNGTAFSFSQFADTSKDTLVGVDDYPDSMHLEVMFTPLSVTEYQDTVEIRFTRNTSSGPVADTAFVELEGNGQSSGGQLELISGDFYIDFPPAETGSMLSSHIMFNNIGADTVFLDTVLFINGGIDGVFTFGPQSDTVGAVLRSINVTDNLMLMPDSIVIYIDFNPDTTYYFEDTVLVIHDRKEGASLVKDTVKIFVSGSGHESFGDLVIEPTDWIDFDMVPIGSDSSFTFTLLNSGLDTLFVDSMQFKNGGFNGVFSFGTVSDTLNDTILGYNEGQDTSYVQIAFQPQIDIFYEDTVYIYHRTPDGVGGYVSGNDIIEVYGEGQTSGGNPYFEPSFQYVNFGYMVSPDTTFRHVFYNSGADTVIFDSVGFLNNGAGGAFSFSPGTPVGKDTILSINLVDNPPDSTIFGVRFNTGATGLFIDTAFVILSIKDGSGFKGDTTYFIYRGFSQFDGGNLTMTPYLNSYDFGEVEVDIPQYIGFILKNYGAANSVIDSVFFTEGGDGGFFFDPFVITPDTVYHIDIMNNPMDSALIRIRFEGTDPRMYLDTLKMFYKNWINGTSSWYSDTVTTVLTGTAQLNGGAPTFNPPPDSMLFGTVGVGSSANMQKFILNVGNDTVFINNMYFHNGGVYSITQGTSTLPDTLLKTESGFNDTTFLDITFTPDTVMNFSDVFVVKYNYKQSGTLLSDSMFLYLEGEGIYDYPLFSTKLHNLTIPNAIQLYDTAKVTLIVNNKGIDTLFIDSMRFANELSVGTTCFAVSDSIDTVFSSVADSFMFDIYFIPDSQGFFYDTLLVYSNSMDTLSTDSVFLSGEGKAFPEIGLSTNSIYYTSITYIGEHRIDSLYIVNSGYDTLRVNNLYTKNNIGFSVTDTFSYPVSLPVDDSLTVHVEFAPTSSGLLCDTLYVLSNVPWDSLKIVELSGDGDYPAELAIEPPDSMVFIYIAVNDSSVLPLKLYNSGNTSYSISVDSILMDSTIFRMDTTLSWPQTISGTDTLSIGIMFKPQADSIYTDSIRIYTDAPLDQYRIEFLKGIGSIPEIQFTNRNINFGIVLTDSTKEAKVHLKNIGTGELTVNSFSPVNYTDSTYWFEYPQYNVIAGDSVDIRFYFRPDSVKTYTDTILVYSNATYKPVDSLFVAGAGKIFIYGDPSRNCDITAFDASLILQNVVGFITLTALQDSSADVSGNGLVSAYDASLILRYLVGYISVFPVQDTVMTKITPLDKTVAFDYEKVDSKKGEEALLPVISEEVKDVYSIEGSVSFDPKVLKFKEIIPAGNTGEFMYEANCDSGTVKFAFATSKPIDIKEKLFDIKYTVIGKIGEESDLIFNKFLINDRLTKTENGKFRSGGLIPKTYFLRQNYPNPFNPTTTIEYGLPKNSKVKLVIYNILGQEVKVLVDDKEQKAGYYKIEWDSRNHFGIRVASGMYIYRIRAEKFVKVRKMVLIK